MRARGWLGLFGFIVLCNGVGFASAMVANEPSYYLELVRPSWAPPPWIFGPVWTALYTMMGVATWLVVRHSEGPTRRRALATFVVQLAINAAWTPVFFGLHLVGAAAFVIVAVLVAVVAMLLEYRRISTAAGWLIVPLTLWVSFATALNLAIWWLQR